MRSGSTPYTAAAVGEHVVEEYTEEALGHQEVYVVVSGHATFTLDGEEIDAPQGSVVFLRDPSVDRAAVAVEVGTTVLAIGGVPGVHAPSAWEWTFEAERYRESGDHAAALELLAAGRRRFPDNASVLYATACWEAVAGNTEAATAHLTEALALEPKVARWADGDADLDSIRRLPGSPI